MLVVSDSSTMTVGSFGMARDAAGDFVMVWAQSANSFPNPISLRVQRFDAAGKPQGSALEVGATEVEPGTPSVAMDAAGDFVVAWVSTGAPYQETATYDVHAQRYSAAGVAQGGEFLVSTFANFDDINPSVAMDAAGDFVIVWQGEPSPGGVPEPPPAYQIYARRYSAAGTALSDQFLVSNASSNQSWPSVAMDAVGDFVAVWHTGDDQNFGYLAQDILAQRYDAAGAAEGGAFPISTAANTGREDPHVAMDAGGRFVVAWDNFDGSADPTTGDIVSDVHARRFDAAGVPQGSELLVNTFTAGNQAGPSVTMDAGGDFTVAWESENQVAADSSNDSYAQRYSAKGTPVGAEFLVNASTAGSQYSPIAAMDADGDMVVAWSSYLPSTPRDNIYVRRFASEKRLRLGLGATFASATPSPGSGFSMTLAVDNASAATPTGSSSLDGSMDLGLGITASVILPKDVVYQSAHGSDWACTDPADATLNCSYGVPLAAGSAASPLTVMLKAPSETGNLNFSASASSTLKSVTTKSVATSVKVQPAAGSGGTGALDMLSLAVLGLPLLRRQRSRN